MASRKENLRALFTNTRTRVILFITVIVLLFLVILGAYRLLGGPSPQESGAALVGVPGGIRSVPGAPDTSPERARLTDLANRRQYEIAQKTGQSAIPTIIRLQTEAQTGEGIPGEQGVGFAALSREANLGAQRSLWIQTLQEANCSRAAVEKVLSEGATFSIVKQACTCAQLKDDGYGIAELKQICSCDELKRAGFNARQFKDAAYDAGRLRLCGFNACELRNAGYTAQQLKDGGYSDGELRGAGYSPEAINQASGLPSGITAADVRRAGCTPQELQRLRAAGVSAAAILRISACTPSQLKAGGYNAGDLRNAGLSAAQLKKAGFSPDELKRAGYPARELLDAGYTPDELAKAGYSPAQIKAGEAEPMAGISPKDIREANCSPEALKNERVAGVSAKLIHQYAGCSANALKSAGYTDGDLANAGFTPDEIKAAVPVSDQAIRAAGCDPAQLKKLREQGVSAQQIRALNNCTAKALKDAGYSPEDLKAAGYTPQQLLDSGFTPQQLSQAGINPISALARGRAEDCSVTALQAAKAAGVSAKAIRQTLGCDAAAMKAAGYTPEQLHNAGYTAAQLKKAGFTPEELKKAGFTPKQLLDAGYTPSELKNAGFTADQLKDAGLNAAQLKNAGFTAKQLKDAGFDANALRKAGFSPAELEAAGFKPEPTKVVGPPVQVPTVGTPSVLSDIADRATAQQKAADQANKQLQQLMKQQQQQVNAQRFQQLIQQRSSAMLAAANQTIQAWEKTTVQTYVEGQPEKKVLTEGQVGVTSEVPSATGTAVVHAHPVAGQKALIQTGDILFAVLDTSVNSDEQGPVLATIVSGRFKGAKLIGSFSGPSQNSDRVILSFNTMTIPGGSGAISINAYAIDPNTARTALASRVDKHYFYRYGSLFAATFLEGFGNAFQSADTSVTIGGTGGGDNITVTNGINRSALENAVIGLATVGKAWGQVAQQNVNRPTTVELFSGTGIGVLFTQDLKSLSS